MLVEVLQVLCGDAQEGGQRAAGVLGRDGVFATCCCDIVRCSEEEEEVVGMRGGAKKGAASFLLLIWWYDDFVYRGYIGGPG